MQAKTSGRGEKNWGTEDGPRLSDFWARMHLLLLGLSFVLQLFIVAWQPPLVMAFHLAELNGALLLILVFVGALMGPGWVRQPLLPAAMLCLAWATLSLSWTADRWLGQRQVLNLLLPIAAFLAAAQLGRSARWRRRLASTCVAVAGLTAGYSLLVFGGILPASFAQAVRNAAPFVNPDDAAYLFEMFLPLAGVLFVLDTKPWRRILSAYAFVAMGVAHLLTLSRGGWFSIIIGFLVLAFLLRLRASREGKIIAFALAGFVVLWAALRVGEEPLLDRLETLSPDALTEHVEKPGTRPDLWATALRMIATRPVQGFGVNGFERAFPRFRQAGQYVPREVTQSPHNDYLDVATSYGLLGLGLLGWLIIVFLKEARASWGRSRHGPSRLLQAAAFSGVAAVMTHSIFEFGLVLPALALPFAVVAAMALQPVERARRMPRAWIPLGAAAALFFALLAQTGDVYRGTRDLRRGREALRAGRWSEAETLADKACAAIPPDPRAWQTAAYVRLKMAHLARAAGMGSRVASFVAEGRRRAEESLRLNGEDVQSWLVLARLLVLVDAHEALTASATAYGKDPHDPDTALLHGYCLVQAGKRDEAISVLSRILSEGEKSGRVLGFIPYLMRLFPDGATLNALIPPALTKSRAALVTQLERGKRWEEAEPILEKLASIEGDEQARFLVRLASVRARLGETTAAVEAVDRSLALEETAGALAMKGQLHQKVGQVEEATAAWRKAAEAAPENLSYAMALVRLLPEVEALKELLAVAKRFPDRAEPHLLRAEILNRMKEPYQAMKALWQAAQFCPGDARMQDRLAWQYRRVDLPLKAVAAWQRAAELDEKATWPLERLADHHRSRAEWADQRKALEALKERGGTSYRGVAIDGAIAEAKRRERERNARRAYPVSGEEEEE